ncbi:MAG: T9SS type A sorting domain-containing protein [Flavobacterium sp.]|nr:T9SS type A sorting domain-containing protein [Flavobacterium sp.]
MKKLFLIPILLLLWYNKCWSQCPADIIITGLYITTYTNSNTWIASSGLTTIPSGVDVTLDANPSNDGYVLLDVGFETEANAIFTAVVQTPCTLLGTNKNELGNSLIIFPNPAIDFINIKSNIEINNIRIFDINGLLVREENHNSIFVPLNIEQFSKGLYLMKIKTENGMSIQKFMKE